MNFPYEPSVLAQLAERLDMPVTMVRKTAKAIAELPPRIREELLETLRRPVCAEARNVTLTP
jgi:hypothetical protein